jgi:hypothetical protein
MALTPIVSVSVKGNLKDKKLTLIYPLSKLQKGIWQIALDSLAYNTNSDDPKVKVPQLLCGLKCNWITAINYNSNNELLSETPCIFQFFMSKRKDCIINNKTWFEINSLTEFLIFEFINLETNEILNLDCSIYILLLFQRKF